MAYGELKVDSITFTDGVSDATVSVSGLVKNPTFSGNIVVNGNISGTTITGDSAGFSSVTGVTVTGTTANFVSGVFTTQVSGTAITGNTAGFTTITGTTVTGTTANFNTVSGTTVTGGTGNFTSVSATTVTITSGVFASGTAAAPSVSVGTTDNGLYSPGADQVAISTNGAQRLLIDSDGDINIDSGGVFYDATNNRLAIGTTSPDAKLNVVQSSTGRAWSSTGGQGDLIVERNGNSGVSIVAETNSTSTLNFGDTDDENAGFVSYYHNEDAMVFRTNGSGEDMRIDSSGRLLVGTSSARQNFKNSTVSAQLQVEATTTSLSSAAFIANGDADSTNPYPHLFLARGRGTVGTNVIVSSNDRLGAVSYQGNDGSEFVEAAVIYAEVDGTPGSNDMPGRLVFSVTADGASSPTERMRIDSSGNVGIGTTSPAALLHLSSDTGSASPVPTELRIATISVGSDWSTTDPWGRISFYNQDSSGGGPKIHASIETKAATTAGGSSDLTFSTTTNIADALTERMRITSTGHLYVGQTTTNLPGGSNTTTGHAIREDGIAFHSVDNNYALLVNRNTSDGILVQIRREGLAVGSISVTTTATAYNTSSDYRLKENVTPVTDGITRLQQLKPSRFNFIADPGKTVDGFLAHEVQSIVPEAITGEKDAVDDEGNPVYQGIDQSKIVPLVVAALQEAIAKIETLEQRLNDAGIN